MMCRRQRPQGTWCVLDGKILEVDYRCQQQSDKLFGRKFAPSQKNVFQSETIVSDSNETISYFAALISTQL